MRMGAKRTEENRISIGNSAFSSSQKQQPIKAYPAGKSAFSRTFLGYFAPNHGFFRFFRPYVV